MSTDSQNVDPFAAAFGPLYERGALIDVPLLQGADPAHANNAAREAKRAEITAGRVAAARSRAELLQELAVERARAAEFVAAADRKLGNVAEPVSRSAVVDEMLAEDDASEDEWVQADPWLAPADEAA